MSVQGTKYTTTPLVKAGNIKVSSESSRANQQDRVRRNAALMDSVSNHVEASENFNNGIGTLIYGGIKNKHNVGSFLSMYDRYYKAATGRSRYEGVGLQPRRFNQLMIMDRNTMQQIQPFIPGRFIFVPAEMPRCMEILHPEETNYVRTLFMTGVTAVSGFSPRSLETGTVNAMTEQNSYEVITKQTGVTRKLEFTFMTLHQGLFFYKYITTWMQYIYNAGSSAATYPLFTGLEYHEGNHSMNGIYIIPDPSFQMVEDAAAIYNMVPLENDADKVLNQTWGQHEIQNYTVSFKVHTLAGGMPQVTRLAQAVLADYVAEVELHDYYVGDDYLGLGDSYIGAAGKSALNAAKVAERANSGKG